MESNEKIGISIARGLDQKFGVIGESTIDPEYDELRDGWTNDGGAAWG